jgi:hypothetical protein
VGVLAQQLVRISLWFQVAITDGAAIMASRCPTPSAATCRTEARRWSEQRRPTQGREQLPGPRVFQATSASAGAGRGVEAPARIAYRAAFRPAPIGLLAVRKAEREAPRKAHPP